MNIFIRSSHNPQKNGKRPTGLKPLAYYHTNKHLRILNNHIARRHFSTKIKLSENYVLAGAYQGYMAPGARLYGTYFFAQTK